MCPRKGVHYWSLFVKIYLSLIAPVIPSACAVQLVIDLSWDRTRNLQHRYETLQALGYSDTLVLYDMSDGFIICVSQVKPDLQICADSDRTVHYTLL